MNDSIVTVDDEHILVFDEPETRTEESKTRMKIREVVVMVVGMLLMIAPIVFAIISLRGGPGRAEESISSFILALSVFNVLTITAILLITLFGRSRLILEARGVLALMVLGAGSVTLFLLILLLTGM